eukprot:396841-Pleurochrysis_carterae.AAC.1
MHAQHSLSFCRAHVALASAGWHAISFGSHGRFAELASWHCTRLQRTRDLDSCSNLSLASLPAAWVAANHIDVRTRGAGWWRWKPYTILQKLTSMREGEVLVHLDYDLVPTTDLRALFCIGQKVRKGVGAFHMPCHTDRAWTKRELAHEMRATDEMLDTVQIYAGLLVLRKNVCSSFFFCPSERPVAPRLQRATMSDVRKGGVTTACKRTRLRVGGTGSTLCLIQYLISETCFAWEDEWREDHI